MVLRLGRAFRLLSCLCRLAYSTFGGFIAGWSGAGVSNGSNGEASLGCLARFFNLVGEPGSICVLGALHAL